MSNEGISVFLRKGRHQRDSTQDIHYFHYFLETTEHAPDCGQFMFHNAHNRVAFLHADHEATIGICLSWQLNHIHRHQTCISTFPPLQQEIPAFQAKMFQYYCLLSGSCKHDQTHYLSLWKDLNNDKHAYPNDNRGPTCTHAGLWEEI